jgi:uncharacterized protein YpmB
MEEGWGLGGKATTDTVVRGKQARRRGSVVVLAAEGPRAAWEVRYENDDMTDGDWLTGYRLGMRT